MIFKILLIYYLTFSIVFSHKVQLFDVTNEMKILVDQNSILSTMKADSILICSHQCQLHKECRLANYMEETKECQLLDEIDEEHQQSEPVEGMFTLKKV